MIALVVTRLDGIVFMKNMIAIILLCSVSLTTKPKMNQQTLLITVPFLANVALDQIRHDRQRDDDITNKNAGSFKKIESEMSVRSRRLVQ